MDPLFSVANPETAEEMAEDVKRYVQSIRGDSSQLLKASLCCTNVDELAQESR